MKPEWIPMDHLDQLGCHIQVMDEEAKRTGNQLARELAHSAAMLLNEARAAWRERGPDTGFTCSICEWPIYGQLIGTGAGDGQSFGHPVCYWRLVADRSCGRPAAPPPTQGQPSLFGGQP